MEHESLLPAHKALNTLIENDIDAVMAELDAFYEAHSSFITPEIEMRQPAYYGYAAQLSDLLLERESTEDERQSAYEACHFALTTARMLQGGAVSLHSRNYLEGVTPQYYKECILNDIHQYAKDRVMVRILVNSYLEHIDPSGAAPHIAATIALLTFMHIEQANCDDAYISQQIDDMEREF